MGDVLVYTNEHVVGENETVHIRNREMFEAEAPSLVGAVVWKDEDKDLALIEVMLPRGRRAPSTTTTISQIRGILT